MGPYGQQSQLTLVSCSQAVCNGAHVGYAHLFLVGTEVSVYDASAISSTFRFKPSCIKASIIQAVTKVAPCASREERVIAQFPEP